MSTAIEIRRTDDGAIFARRVDGKPLTQEDREEAKPMAANELQPLAAEVDPPPCWNCRATTSQTKDIHGQPWWVCWQCAKTA